MKTIEEIEADEQKAWHELQESTRKTDRLRAIWSLASCDLNDAKAEAKRQQSLAPKEGN